MSDKTLTDTVFQCRPDDVTGALLLGLFESNPDPVYFKDGEGRWLLANTSGLEVFHLTGKPYQGKTDAELAELAHPFYREAFLNCKVSDERAWSAATLSRDEEVVPLPEGGFRVFDVIKMPLFKPDGSRRGLMVLGREVTERKEAETQLNSRSAILDALISSDWLLHSSESWQKIAPDILGLLGAASKFSRVSLFKVIVDENGSASAVNTTRWTAHGDASFPEQYLTFNFAKEGCLRWLEYLQQGQPVFGMRAAFPVSELKFLQKLGTHTIIMIPINAGGEWWGFMAVERCDQPCEISPQELGALMAAGRSFGVAIQRDMSGARLRQASIAFDSAAEGILITDEDVSIIAINRGFTDITGYREDEVLGQVPNELNPEHVGADKYREIRHALLNEGRWRGEVTNHRKNGESFSEWITITTVRDADDSIVNYVGVFADISDTKQAQQTLHDMVNHDALTGLPNRRLLNELTDHALRRAERERASLAILFVDLDRFKVINDTLGHQVGDKLLVEVSNRLNAVMRESDTVARLGGDEFLVMMDSLRDVEDASRVAKKIVSSLQAEFVIDGKEIFIGASVGISVYPGDGRDVDSLIKAADIAMYKVKSEGKNNYRFYSADLSENAVERFNMESQLRRALERHQFEVYYQPQVSVATGRIVGAEALVRWQHPELGVVSPAKFIPLAEETGLVVQIGEWVLREAAAQVVAWSGQGLNLQSISVNISGMQVQRSNFPDVVYGILVETGCEPSVLELEITESIVMHNTESVISVFNRIKEPGVRLAIDDFGTGYSSLSYLKRLPLDKLKIDQSFVQELTLNADDKAIASAVIALARSLNLKVIAEGVETQDQLATLTEMGCDDVQGYLFGQPVPASEFAAMLMADARNDRPQ
jgi:diguanylate cyclase (GGDEF)-like protein/PAS domain S-box-containing protein